MKKNTKNYSLKQKILLGIIFTCIVLSIAISILLFLNNNNNTTSNIKQIFRHSYINGAWDYRDYGYIIYDNGVIEEYSNSDTNKELKSAKISNNELKQLLSLSESVADNYEEDNSTVLFDAGLITQEIYNNKLEKWIVLSKSGDTFGKNNTEESLEILKLTSQLHKKYLGTGYTSWMN